VIPTRSLLVAVLAAGSFALSAAAARAQEEVPDGPTLYATRTCIACHGPDAKTPLLPEYPRLAGQNAAYTLRQMKDIKSGARSNGNTAAMKGVMHLVSDAEMQVLSDWLSGLDPSK
jgi:cytochrome c